MATRPRNVLLRYLRDLVHPPCAGGVTDAELVRRIVATHDEAAFELLVWRHGAMVLRVCQGILGDGPEAEDAFQATFLVLVRKACSVRKHGSVGGWLYQVAYRASLRARAVCIRRRAREQPGIDLRTIPACGDPMDEAVLRELRPVLYEEIHRLPAKYRTPTVLCYLEGKTHAEAARQLGWPTGTVAGRLARARDLLRRRLTRRGLTFSVGLFGLLQSSRASAALSAELVGSTIQAALTAAGKSAAGAATSAPIANLTEGVLHAMFLSKVRIALALVLVLGLIGAGAAVWTSRLAAAAEAARADQRAEAPLPAKAQDKAPKKVSFTERLTRLQLDGAEKELIQVQSDLRKARVELALLKARKGGGRPSIAKAAQHELMEKDPDVKKLRERAAAIEDEMRRVRRVVAKAEQRDAALKPLAKERDEVAVALQVRRKEVLVLMEDQLRDKAQVEWQDRLERQEDRVAFLTELEKVLLVEIDRLYKKAALRRLSPQKRLELLEKEVRELKASLRKMRSQK
jgi:RNA polymerase sigma factor (sigma-70 family)